MDWKYRICYSQPSGILVRAPGKLTDNASASSKTWDDSPSIAVAPNGTVGVVGAATFMKVQGANSIITFTCHLCLAGVRLAAPVQISNYGYSSAVIFSLTMAASSDNQFVIGQIEQFVAA